MTAETLKPFISPASVNSYVKASHSSSSSVHHRSSRHLLVIAASVLVAVLIATLLGLTIWNTNSIANLQTEVDNLNKVIESMQKRLGITYLDDLSELEKEDELYNNDLIDDTLPDEDEDDDDDNDNENYSGSYEDDEDFTYAELIQKFSDYKDEDDNANANNDDSTEKDDLYDDFEKFKDSKKRKPKVERKTRSVSNDANKDKNPESKDDKAAPSFRSYNHKSLVAPGDHFERRRSPMRLHSSRRRRFPLVKSAKTLNQNHALYEIEATKPAVHFHLTHKKPYHQAAYQVRKFDGDMYIGTPSWTNEHSSFDSYFTVKDGVLTVHQSGLYYVYAQVCYFNRYLQNGFIIFHGDKPFLQCLSHIHNDNMEALNTCHTSGLIYLKANEHIHLRDHHKGREVHLAETNNRSYFGLIKI